MPRTIAPARIVVTAPNSHANRKTRRQRAPVGSRKTADSSRVGVVTCVAYPATGARPLAQSLSMQASWEAARRSGVRRHPPMRLIPAQGHATRTLRGCCPDPQSASDAVVAGRPRSGRAIRRTGTAVCRLSLATHRSRRSNPCAIGLTGRVSKTTDHASDAAKRFRPRKPTCPKRGACVGASADANTATHRRRARRGRRSPMRSRPGGCA